MNEQISRPLEQSEINRLSGGDPYRLAMLISQNNQERLMVELRQEIKDMGRWQVEHERKDDVRAAKSDMRLEAIEKSIDGAGGIRSGVNDYEENWQQFIGMRRLIVGIVAVVGTIGAAVLGVLQIVKIWGKP